MRSKKEQIFTLELRDSLKEIMQREIDNLSKTLEELEPKDRINILCKLMPYVFPKVESVHLKEGEPYIYP